MKAAYKAALALVLALVMTTAMSVGALAAPAGGTPDEADQEAPAQDAAQGEADETPDAPEEPAADEEEPEDPVVNDGMLEAIMIGENTIITDTVTYEGLRVGTTYTLTGVLMDYDTKQPLEVNGAQVTGTTTFIAEQADGTASVGFTLDTRSMAGKTIVVFEKLMEGDVQIAAHEDIDDPDQTVRFVAPDISTKAFGDQEDSSIVLIGSTVTVTDTITYTNLKPNVEYTASGTLVDTAGNPIMNGENPVTSSATFTPTSPNGTEQVTFTFDATALGGKKAVVYEEILAGGVVIGEHKDPRDADQTVEFQAPEITTSAAGADGKKTLTIGGNTVVVDTVTYKNARPGQEFTVNGTLWIRPEAAAEDEAAGEPQQLMNRDGSPVTASATGTASESGTGTIELTYTFDSLELSGKTVVVYEEMQMNGNVVAEHMDITDDKQAVKFEDLEITTLLLAEGDSHESSVGAAVELTDQVTYSNLTPGMEYELRASLVDPDGKPVTIGGTAVTASAKFTPESADGTAEVKITVDARTLDGKSVVAYEELWLGDVKLGEHKDAGDENQTVSFSTPKIKTRARGAVEDTVRIEPAGDDAAQSASARASSSSEAGSAAQDAAQRAARAVADTIRNAAASVAPSQTD